MNRTKYALLSLVRLVGLSGTIWAFVLGTRTVSLQVGRGKVVGAGYHIGL